MKKILTVAGYDPSSGAGITKDLEVFSSLGAHGLSVPTCIVLQNPKGVRDVHPVPFPQFYEMIKMVKEQPPVDGIKVGALWSEGCVDTVVSFLDGARDVPLIVDPIIAAKNGVRLITEKGFTRMVELLIPKADVITPNTDEASAITGRKVTDLKKMKDCAKSLLDKGPQSVIIKGGHLKGEPVDLFYDGNEFLTERRKRIDRTTHGTGCIFSSLITAFRAEGYERREAFLGAERLMGEMLGNSYRIDRDGYFYTSPGITGSLLGDRWNVVRALKEAGEMLKRDNPVSLIPAVQMDMGYAIKAAKGVEDVAAFPGRVGCHDGKLYIKGEPLFGASTVVARLILTCMRRYPHLRSCATIRFDTAIIEKALRKGFSVLHINKKKRPKVAAEEKGGHFDGLVDQALRRTKGAPDIMCDPGDIGKEPFLGVFARDPLEIIEKMEMITL